MSDAIARKVATDMQSASWIREMFEKGRRLKAELGAEKVYDFSLGNPNADPPEAYFAALRSVAAERDAARHRYMPNAGFDETRAAVARFVSREYRLEIDGPSVILTTGAAGGMNVVLHAICNPGDEVITLAPFFPEYRFYIEQAGAKMVLLQTDEVFQPDLEVIAAALTERTRAVLINTPNNPSGAVYTAEKCRALAELLGKHDRPERPLYLVCDDPYRRIIYDLDWCPTPAHYYPRTILVSSYSKDLSIAGERAGYVAVPPAVPDKLLLLGALTMLNRTLGFVNSPAFTQRVIARCAEALCDVGFYQQNRDLLCDALREYGYELVKPRGALYAFPKTPLEDDAAFVDSLLAHRILAVPGRGFGRPGYMRVSFCVARKTIEDALPGFKAAIEQVGT
ncbi:MAG: pyridoxal phosphate-dependent aminotransferase [Phycisphaerae bacterium]|nr:pyridoxal phosphate-dependent aminotransferase [Phycisphaerae bacterium]